MMSYEIDLRSREYLKRELIFKKSTLFKVLLIVLVFSPFFFYYGLNYYHQLLVNQAADLEKEVNLLRREAEPLIIITSELETIDKRKQLIKAIKPDRTKWSNGLHLLHDAAPAQVAVTGIKITRGGSIEIDGASSNLHAPARYRQNLSGLSDFGQTELNIMTLNSDQSYSFRITTQLSMGDEPDDSTKEIAAQ